MKTRHAVQVRRRVRRFLGWALILSVALGEFWVMGSFVARFSRVDAASPWQLAPPPAQMVMGIR